MLKQSTSHVIMVPPVHFGFNPQTAATNPFMHTPESLHIGIKEIQKAVFQEFDVMVAVLKEKGIDVLILPSREDAITPDGVFPNNWFSHHADGKLVLYPMLTPNRRLERQQDALAKLLVDSHIPVAEIIDLSSVEEKGTVLESTGSMVLDRVHKVAFAMASPRTFEEVFTLWCAQMDYKGVYLKTPLKHRKEVYHTNLLMSIGSDFAVVCFEVLEDAEEQAMLKEKLESLGKTIIDITLEQVYAYCGNILELQNNEGKKIIILSDTAHKAYTKAQLSQLASFAELVVLHIPTIEEIGGGGVRCMVAEVFAEE